MQSRDFCFWLQGFFELTNNQTLSSSQVNLIKAHLDLVFKHDVSISRKQMEHMIPKTSDDLSRYLIGNPPYDPTHGMTATC